MEALDQARDQATKHEGEGLETFDGDFEIDAFLDCHDSGFGDRGFVLFPTCPCDETEELRTEASGEVTT
jgi:hypothetical protein